MIPGDGGGGVDLDPGVWRQRRDEHRPSTSVHHCFAVRVRQAHLTLDNRHGHLVLALHGRVENCAQQGDVAGRGADARDLLVAAVAVGLAGTKRGALRIGG